MVNTVTGRNKWSWDLQAGGGTLLALPWGKLVASDWGILVALDTDASPSVRRCPSCQAARRFTRSNEM